MESVDERSVASGIFVDGQGPGLLSEVVYQFDETHVLVEREKVSPGTLAIRQLIDAFGCADRDPEEIMADPGVNRSIGILYETAFKAARKNAPSGIDPADIASVAITRLIKRLSNAEPLSADSNEGYVVRIVKNLAVDSVRRPKAKPKTISLTDLRGEVPDLQSHSDLIDVESEIASMLRDLEELVGDDGKISFFLRSVVPVLLAGDSMNDVAQNTGLNSGTVKSRTSRARSELAELLQGDSPRSEAVRDTLGISTSDLKGRRYYTER